MVKFLLVLVGSMFVVIVTAFIMTLFFYSAWNGGVVPAISFVREISLAQAFWLSLMISSIGGAFKSSLKLKE